MNKFHFVVLFYTGNVLELFTDVYVTRRNVVFVYNTLGNICGQL